MSEAVEVVVSATNREDAMADVQGKKFLEIYGHLLVQTWGLPQLKQRFKADPAAVLKEFGLDPEGAKINLIKPGKITSQTTPTSQVKLWNEGKKKGVIDFVYPEEPPEDIDSLQLSEEQLMLVGGAGTYCCSCCPCCCC